MEDKSFHELGIPLPPEGAVFGAGKVREMGIPHPYCITPKHVAYASDHCGGILTTEAIAGAERAGAQCDICRKLHRSGKQDRVLSHDEHRTQLVAFIVVPDNGTASLRTMPGLHEYLLSIKDVATKAGIQGFGFVTETSKKVHAMA